MKRHEKANAQAGKAVPRTIDARWALTSTGWQSSVRVTVGADRRIQSIAAQPGMMTCAEHRTVDMLIPGMPNAHCHAFQRGIAGLTERAGPANGVEGGSDSFWTWRERMYQAVDLLDANRLFRTALDLYRGLQRRGYTSVAEFHYVHRPGGNEALEMAVALIEAAEAAGIELLLLPVLYRRGGLDASPLSARQRPFGLSLDAYARLLEAVAAMRKDRPRLTVGVAPHSLRAVAPDDLAELLALRAAVVSDCPVHIHVSEQRAEVDAARHHLGATPIEWLCANAAVDERWVLVHATHATAAELSLARQRDAVICICTTTEANLGDGAFDIERWWSLGGALAIGSDSNVGLDPAEELRWLEYQARLRRQGRAMLVDPQSPHPGASLWRRAVAGGRQAFGVAEPGLSAGGPASMLALAVDDNAISPDEALDDFLFAGRAVRIDPAGLD